MTSGIVGFSMYIEASGSGRLSNQLRDRLGAERVKEIRSQWSGKLTTAETTFEQVQAALGAPDHIDSSSIGYILPVRPAYLYVFEFDSQKRSLRRCGFRRVPSRLPPPRSSGLDSYKRELINVGVTSFELREWLGDPLAWFGWWPEEIWEYPEGLILRLRHGVVESDE
jgi:hypothetical protein